MTAVAFPHLLESVVQLTSQRDQHSLQLCLTKTLQELIAADEIALYALPADTEDLVLKLLVKSLPPDQCDDAHKPHLLPNLDQDAELKHCLTSKKQVVCAINAAQKIRVIHPVTNEQGGVIGFLIVHCAVFIQQDQDLIASFLHIYHNYLQLIDANTHDPLTGLLNRKTFSERMLAILAGQREPQRRTIDGARDRKEYCLAMLDIDHFKSVNDKFGHLYGDEVLLLFSRLMNETFRDEDQLYRYGGEEFIAVLKGVNLSSSSAILERFRKKTEAFHFPQVGNITVSIGAVEINNQDLPTTVVEQADKALYYAKDHGRNQVCLYEVLLAEGKLSNIQSQGAVELF